MGTLEEYNKSLEILVRNKFDPDDTETISRVEEILTDCADLPAGRYKDFKIEHSEQLKEFGRLILKHGLLKNETLNKFCTSNKKIMRFINLAAESLKCSEPWYTYKLLTRLRSMYINAGDKKNAAYNCYYLAKSAYQFGNVRQAIKLMKEAENVFEAFENPHPGMQRHSAYASSYIARWAMELGNFEYASENRARALRKFEQLEEWVNAALIYHFMARDAAKSKKFGEAYKLKAEEARLYRKQAELYRAQGKPQEERGMWEKHTNAYDMAGRYAHKSWQSYGAKSDQLNEAINCRLKAAVLYEDLGKWKEAATSLDHAGYYMSLSGCPDAAIELKDGAVTLYKRAGMSESVEIEKAKASIERIKAEAYTIQQKQVFL